MPSLFFSIPSSFINTSSVFPSHFLVLSLTGFLTATSCPCFPISSHSLPHPLVSLIPLPHVSPLGPSSCLYKQLSAGLHLAFMAASQTAGTQRDEPCKHIHYIPALCECVFSASVPELFTAQGVQWEGCAWQGKAVMASHWHTVGANEISPVNKSKYNHRRIQFQVC